MGMIGVKLMELSRISQKMSMRIIFGVPSWLYTMLHSVLWMGLQNLKHVCHLYIGGVRALIKSCQVGSRRECARVVTITTLGIPGIGSFPELCIYLAFGRISFHLHYICISFAFRIAPRISIFALHFICI